MASSYGYSHNSYNQENCLIFKVHTGFIPTVHSQNQLEVSSYCTSCSLTGSPRNQLPPLPTRALLHLPLPTSCSLPEDCPQQTPQSRHSRPLLASLPANTNCRRKKSPFILYSRDRTPTSPI